MEVAITKYLLFIIVTNTIIINIIITTIIIMLIASAKSRSVRGASHQPAFMSSRLTISHAFYLPYLPSAWGVLIDVPWSLMIGPMVAPLVHFLGMVWFQVYEGSQCYSKEWVWNSTTELCWKVVGKENRLNSKTDSRTGDPWSPPRKEDPLISILWIPCQKAREPYLPYLPSTWGVLRDVPWSLIIGSVVAPLAHFLGMVWFQVYGGSR